MPLGSQHWEAETGRSQVLVARQSILKEGPGSVEYPVYKNLEGGERKTTQPLASVWLCRDMAPAHKYTLMQKGRLGPGRGKDRIAFQEDSKSEWRAPSVARGPCISSPRAGGLPDSHLLPSTSPYVCLCLQGLTCE